MTNEINTDRSPDATYRNKTDADATASGVEGQDFRTRQLPNGRIGIWHRKPTDRFAPAIVLNYNPDGMMDSKYCFPSIADAKAWADEQGWSENHYTIEGGS